MEPSIEEVSVASLGYPLHIHLENPEDVQW